MDKIGKKRIVCAVGLLIYLVGLTAVLADDESTTVTFVIPTSVDHSLAYGGSCSGSDFFFVESDATKDGTQDMINVTSDSAGTAACQNSSLSAMTVSNVGSVNANITADFTSALPAGVTVKAALAAAGWEDSCSGVVAVDSCADITDSAEVVIIEDLTAQTGTDDVWWFCDMDDFNSGVATTGVERTLQTHAVDNS